MILCLRSGIPAPFNKDFTTETTENELRHKPCVNKPEIFVFNSRLRERFFLCSLRAPWCDCFSWREAAYCLLLAAFS